MVDGTIVKPGPAEICATPSALSLISERAALIRQAFRRIQAAVPSSHARPVRNLSGSSSTSRVGVTWSVDRQEGPPFGDGLVSGMAMTMSSSPAVATIAKGQEGGIASEARLDDCVPSVKAAKKDEMPGVFFDVMLRLEDRPALREALEAYCAVPWAEWAEREKPRRRSIAIYQRLFEIAQRLSGGYRRRRSFQGCRHIGDSLGR